MTMKTYDLPASPPRRPVPSPTKIAAVLAWLGAVYTTYAAVTSLQAGTPWFVALATAAVLQFILTAAERPILHGRPDLFTGVVLAFDAVVNAGGVYPMLRNVGRTPSAQMVADIGVAPDVGALPAILLSLVVGLIIAAAPEALWRMRE
jgi:hypothetical protein